MTRILILILFSLSVVFFYCSEEEIIVSTDSRPSAPVNLSVAPGDKIAYLKWQHPLNSGNSQIIQYNVYRSQSPDNDVLITSTAPNTFLYNDSNLTNGTSYYYYVTAVNNDGEGERSKQVSVIPVLIHLTPSEPRNVQAELLNRNVTLTWMPPYTSGISPVTKYRIYRSQIIENMSLIKELNSNITTFTDTSLLINETYKYGVTAVNNIGEGLMSGIITVEIISQNPLADYTWLSRRENIAPALRKAPYRLINIIADFNYDNTYNIVTVDSGLTETTFTGTYQTIDSNASSGIKQITLSQSAPTSAVLQGIFRVDSLLILEIIQVQPPVQGLSPPTISGGFGSTALNGVQLGEEWIQRFQKQL